MLSSFSSSSLVTGSAHVSASAAQNLFKTNMPSESIFTGGSGSVFRRFVLMINLEEICDRANLLKKEKGWDFREAVSMLFNEYVEFLEQKNQYGKYRAGFEQQITTVYLSNYPEDENRKYPFFKDNIFLQELLLFLENDFVFLGDYPQKLFAKKLFIDMKDFMFFLKSVQNQLSIELMTSKLDKLYEGGLYKIFLWLDQELQIKYKPELKEIFECKLDKLRKYNKHFLSLQIDLSGSTTEFMFVTQILFLQRLLLVDCVMSVEECCVFLTMVQRGSLFELVFNSFSVVYDKEEDVGKIVDLLSELKANPGSSLSKIDLLSLRFNNGRLFRSFSPSEAVRLSRLALQLETFKIECDFELKDGDVIDRFFWEYSGLLSNSNGALKNFHLILNMTEEKINLDFSCLFEALKKNNKLKNFSLSPVSVLKNQGFFEKKQVVSLMNFLEYNDQTNESTLTHLTLDYFSFPEGLEKQFFAALKVNKSLLTLDVKFDDSPENKDIIENKCFDELSDVLKENKTLTCVNLWKHSPDAGGQLAQLAGVNLNIPIREKEQNRLNQNKRRHEVWAMVSILIAFSRVNRQTIFQRSILPLLPCIIRLNQFMPFEWTYKLKDIKENKKRLHTSIG